MREITVWRWIFGLALAPTVLLALLSVDTAMDASALESALVVVITYLASLLVTSLLAGLAIALTLFASRARHFIAELLGLRG